MFHAQKGSQQHAASTSASSSLPSPPDDRTMFSYVEAPQQRWFFVAAAVAYLGVALSLSGLARASWLTWVFLIPVLLWGVENVMALRTATRPRVITARGHRRIVAGFAPREWPSIDVFLPSCGEPLEVLEHGFSHVAKLRYAGQVRVYVLDDSARPAVARAAAAHEFTYLARGTSEARKAGNVQYGLTHSSGDAILILDADFVPREDFLEHTVPHLGDPEVAIVQTPQYFDVSRDQGWLQRAAGATQELFFRLLQPSRDAIDAAICVGTSALYRRAALADIGGFPQVDHSEDIVTGVRLTSYGWRVRYVPIIVSKGTCPDDIDPFIAQQYRWCEGTVRLLVDPAFAEDRDFTWSQRMCYWGGFVFYLTTAINAILAPLPGLVMVTWFQDRIATANVAPLLGAMFVWLVLLPAISTQRWRPEVLRVQAIYGFAHLFSLIDIIRGRVEAWVPTGEAGADVPIGRRVRRVMLPYLVATHAATVIGLTIGTLRWGLGRYWTALLFEAFALYIVVPVVVAAMGQRTAYRMRSGAADAAGAVGNRTTAPISIAVATPSPSALATANSIAVATASSASWLDGDRPLTVADVLGTAATPITWSGPLPAPDLPSYSLPTRASS